MILSAKARIAGVIGFPAKHSLSPRLHGYWLEHYAIDGTYIPLEVRPENLRHVVKALPYMGFRGANITVPHKEAVMEYLDIIDPVAQHIGAVNTVIVEENGVLRGTNTDAYGFIQNLKDNGALDAQGKTAVILGAGGAARAVIAGLIEENIGRIVLLNRTRENSEILAMHFGPVIRVKEWQERNEVLAEADILVNTTLLGMEGQLPLELSLSKLKADALVTDIVYKPLETALLLEAKSRGNSVVDGLGMLLYQAVKGFEAWYGITPEVTGELRKFVLGTLKS
jgi:shikimate dehydrogenase